MATIVDPDEPSRTDPPKFDDVQVRFVLPIGYDSLQLFIWRRSNRGHTTVLCANGEWKIISEDSQMEPAIELTLLDHKVFLKRIKDSASELFMDKEDLVKDEKLSNLRDSSLHLMKDLERSQKLNERLLAVLENRK